MLSILSNGRRGAASLLPSLSAAGLRIITTSGAAGAEAAAAPSSKEPMMKEFQVYRYFATNKYCPLLRVIYTSTSVRLLDTVTAFLVSMKVLLYARGLVKQARGDALARVSFCFWCLQVGPRQCGEARLQNIQCGHQQVQPPLCFWVLAFPKQP